MEKRPYKLPGGKVEVATRRGWFRAMAQGGRMFGPSYRNLMHAARSGDRNKLHEAERRWAGAMVSALDLTVETAGLRHVNPKRSYVVVALHEGFTDLLAIQRLPLDMVYPAAEELFDWPYLGPYLSASRQPSISRANGSSAYRTLLRAGRKAAARRESLVVFPQGSILGIEIAFTGGAFRSAQHLGIPVLPVVLTGSSEVWDYPFRRELHFGQTVRMEVLEPIPADVAVSRAKDLEREMKERALRARPKPRRYLPARDGWWDDYRFEIDEAFPDVARLVEDHRTAIRGRASVS